MIAVQIEKTGQKKDVFPIASLTVFPLNSKLIFPVLQLLFPLFTAESGFSSFMWTKDQQLFLLNFLSQKYPMCSWRLCMNHVLGQHSSMNSTLLPKDRPSSGPLSTSLCPCYQPTARSLTSQLSFKVSFLGLFF